MKTLNRDHYFCAFCVQDNEPTLDQLVEVTFTVNPRIRRIGAHDPSTLSHAEYMRQIFSSSGAVVSEDIEAAIQRVTLDLMELQPGEKAAMSLTLPKGLFFHVPYPQEATAEHLRATRERAFEVWRDISKIAAAF